MLRKLRTFTVLYLIGAIVLVSGVIVYLYPYSAISGLREKLLDPSLSQQERWQYDGALTWWTAQQSTILIPVFAVLVITGFLILVFAMLSGLFSMEMPQKAPR